MKQILLLGAALVLLTGCGSSGVQSACVPTGFGFLVRPADPTAAPDHAATPPANQELFEAGLGPPIGPEPCVYHELYAFTHAQWTTSDPKNVTISSADDATNGLATCVGPTQAGATVSATLTAYGFTETVSTPIVCK